MVYTQPVRLQVADLPRHKEEPMYPISTEFPWDEFSSALLDQLKEPRSIEDTGIPQEYLSGIALKILYYEGIAKGWQVAQAMRLNFSSIVEPLLQDLKTQHLIQVLGGDHGNRASYRYGITDKGSIRARELLERNRYTGPCPVTLKHYVDVVKLQAKNRGVVNETDVRYAMQGLVLPNDVLDRLGPAVNSFKSLFLYGPPGNGKTTLARATAHRLLSGNIMIPHAIYESGQVIKVFDAEVHPVMDSEEAQLSEANGLDKRWVRCGPPTVITGGELTLKDLDLSWSDTNRYYEAPFQLKANGGLLLIDDFGRQQLSPKDLLNRWIVPLEERIDFLTFHTGKKFAVPFETLIVFSTNLNPDELVDEAFLRRIRHKLNIDNPTDKHYYRIFINACRERNIKFDRTAFLHLLRTYYLEPKRQLKACHPRDLLDQILDYSSYRDERPKMTTEMIDLAARSYFGELM